MRETTSGVLESFVMPVGGIKGNCTEHCTCQNRGLAMTAITPTPHGAWPHARELRPVCAPIPSSHSREPTAARLLRDDWSDRECSAEKAKAEVVPAWSS